MQKLLDDANNSDITTNPKALLPSAFNALKNECLNLNNLPSKEAGRLRQQLERLTKQLNDTVTKLKHHEWVSQFSAFDAYLEKIKTLEEDNAIEEAQHLLPQPWQVQVTEANQRFSIPESHSFTTRRSPLHRTRNLSRPRHPCAQPTAAH